MGSQIRKAKVTLATLITLLLACNKYTCFGVSLLENNGNANSTFSCEGRLAGDKCLTMGEEMEYLEYMAMDLSQYSSSRLLFGPPAGGGSQTGHTGVATSVPSCGKGTAYGPCEGGKVCRSRYQRDC